jgi:hypothetical protein
MDSFENKGNQDEEKSDEKDAIQNKSPFNGSNQKISKKLNTFEVQFDE